MGIKNSFISTYFVVLLVAFSGCASAQNYQTRIVDGKSYYIYPVAPGNTLFAISRQFAVEVDDLVKANPGADQGLSVGQEVLVPQDAIDKKVARKSDIKTDGAYILHTVQRKETFFSLAKQYGVTVDQLSELNPEAAVSLSTGATIRIPVQQSTKVDSVFLAPAQSDTFMVHQVARGETPYSIAKKYEVQLDSLNKTNNEFPSGLRVGQWITIPKYKEAFREQLEAAQKPEMGGGVNYKEGSRNKYKLALLLPFELHQSDTINKSLSQGKDMLVLTEIALEYYRGTQIALDSLRKLGLNADVYVYDVGEDVVDAREVLRKPQMNDVDIIFGPMHKASLAVISDMTREKGTYIVSPNTFSNEVFEDNPYLFRVNASRETMLKYLANYVAINHANDNVVMVNSERSKDWPFRNLFKTYYNEAVQTYPNKYSDSLRSATKAGFSDAGISKWLRTDVKNILVVPSNELAFVSDFMTRLSRLSESKYDIQVYGLDQWLRYDNMEAAYKNRFKLRLAVPYFVDYEREAVIDFLKEYREKYEMEPSKWGYGFLGYDLTLYFGLALLEKGLSFPVNIGDNPMSGTYTNYRFGKSTTGKDFENKSVYIIEYDDYQIKRIN